VFPINAFEIILQYAPIFNRIELWPIVYFVLLMWIMAAMVLARFLEPYLLAHVPAWLAKILMFRVEIRFTSDRFVSDIFDQNVLTRLNRLLLFALIPDLARLLRGSACFVRQEPVALRKFLVPEQYWSGCPPPYSL